MRKTKNVTYPFKAIMNTDTSTIPIFFRLFESQGSATDKLVLKISSLAATVGVTEDIKLINIHQRDDNPSQNVLIYALHTKPSRQRHSVLTGQFLENLFKQFFSNHPSFTEPPTNGVVPPNASSSPRK